MHIRWSSWGGWFGGEGVGKALWQYIEPDFWLWNGNVSRDVSSTEMGKTNKEPQKSGIDPSTSLQPEKSES